MRAFKAIKRPARVSFEATLALRWPEHGDMLNEHRESLADRLTDMYVQAKYGNDPAYAAQRYLQIQHVFPFEALDTVLRFGLGYESYGAIYSLLWQTDSALSVAGRLST